MNSSKKNWINISLIVVAIGLIGFFYYKYRVAPDLDLAKLNLKTPEGQTVNLSDYKGKAIFLNFWQTWCGPCCMEMSSIEKAKQLCDSTGIVFIAVTDENPDDVSAFRDAEGYSFPFLISGDKLQSLGINAYPTTYLIDKSGKIVMTKIGAADWSSPVMLDRLKNLANSKN